MIKQFIMWTVITVMVVLAIAVIYLVIKDLTKGIAVVSGQIKWKKIRHGLLVGGIVLLFFNPDLLPVLFWKICGIALIGLGYVIYPILVIIFRWQNRHNPEILKQLDDRIKINIENAAKYGQ